MDKYHPIGSYSLCFGRWVGIDLNIISFGYCGVELQSESGGREKTCDEIELGLFVCELMKLVR